MTNKPMILTKTIIDEQIDHKTAPRWAILVGQREEPLYEYLRDQIVEIAASQSRLHVGFLDPWHTELNAFAERHMVSTTPAVLLLHKGSQQAMLSGAVPGRMMRDEISRLCQPKADDRLNELMAEMDDAGPSSAV